MAEKRKRKAFIWIAAVVVVIAVLDVNAAEGIQTQYPEIEDWYIGGHSLGGSMAASYLANHVEEYEGLILWRS